MKKIILSMAAMVSISSANAEVVSAGDAEKGKANYAVCMGCHGATGAGMPAAGYPKLAGQSEQYIYDQLTAFKNGTRTNPTMTAMAGMLATDADVQNVSAYIATLK